MSSPTLQAKRTQERRKTEEADRSVLEAAEEHPIAAYHTIDDPNRFNTIRAYASKSAAAAALKRLRRRRLDRLPLVGKGIVDAKGTGRPVDIYFRGTWDLKADNGRHTLKETDYALATLAKFPGCRFRRGPHTGERRHDLIQMMPDDKEFGVEIECGSMSEEKVKRHFERLIGYANPILVAVDPKYDAADVRIKRLIAWLSDVEDLLDYTFFGALGDIVTDPLGKVWIDCETTVTNAGFTLKDLWKNPALFQRCLPQVQQQ